MALEDAKKFLAMAREDEELQDRIANKGKEEVMAVAKESGLDFSDEELQEAASIKELSPDEMVACAGGRLKPYGKSYDPLETICPKRNGEKHVWIRTGHKEDEWFAWLKDGGLFSVGFDYYKCSVCGETCKKAT